MVLSCCLTIYTSVIVNDNDMLSMIRCLTTREVLHMKVAWIGLGRIGKPMALRVLQAGHSLVGHARTPGKLHEMEDAGARLTTSLIQAVAEAEIVCVNVYSEEQLRAVMFECRALTAIKPDAVLVIHSTVGPAIIAELAAARRDIRLLDAAFSGTDKNAAAGTIALMVGGHAEALDEARPVLSSYADFISHLGPAGAGMAMKLVNNSLFAAQMLLADDALRILMGHGIDKDIAVETLARSSGGSFAVQQFGPGIDPRQRMEGVWPYMQKDIAVARAAAAKLGLNLGMLEVATRPFLKEWFAGGRD
jgi:3-hydroxyisobutyrate dehydrogenase-like beta-hydroxyacid dehydrogenase